MTVAHSPELSKREQTKVIQTGPGLLSVFRSENPDICYQRFKIGCEGMIEVVNMTWKNGVLTFAPVDQGVGADSVTGFWIVNSQLVLPVSDQNRFSKP